MSRVAGAPYVIPGNRAADRGRCQNSPDHSLNMSVVYEIPAVGGSAVARGLTGGWLSSSDFGKVTSLAAGTAPRIVQHAMKYLF